MIYLTYKYIYIFWKHDHHRIFNTKFHNFIRKFHHAAYSTYTCNHVAGSHYRPSNFGPCRLIKHKIYAQVRWTGHIIHKENHSIPRRLLHGELSGRRHQDRPKKQYKGLIKTNLYWFKRCVLPTDLGSMTLSTKYPQLRRSPPTKTHYSKKTVSLRNFNTVLQNKVFIGP